jgi:hypothetical protein
MKDLNITSSDTYQIRTRYVNNRSLFTLWNDIVPSCSKVAIKPSELQVDMKRFEVLSSDETSFCFPQPIKANDGVMT